MVICHSGKSAISANKIADEDDAIFTNRGVNGDVNWGRYRANTRLNPDISNVTNKRRMRELFRDNDVPMPRLINLNDVVGFTKYHKVIGRPDHHMKGRGFWEINGLEDLRRACQGTRRKKAATHFMEYIVAPREYRVHIFKGKSIRISEKKFDEERNYTTIKPGDISLRKVRKAAKCAVSAVGLDFGAVDILARGDNNDEVFVLEVNAAPGLGGTMPQLYADTFKRYLRGDWG